MFGASLIFVPKSLNKARARLDQSPGSARLGDYFWHQSSARTRSFTFSKSSSSLGSGNSRLVPTLVFGTFQSGNFHGTAWNGKWEKGWQKDGKKSRRDKRLTSSKLGSRTKLSKKWIHFHFGGLWNLENMSVWHKPFNDKSDFVSQSLCNTRLLQQKSWRQLLYSQSTFHPNCKK